MLAPDEPRVTKVARTVHCESLRATAKQQGQLQDKVPGSAHGWAERASQR